MIEKYSNILTSILIFCLILIGVYHSLIIAVKSDLINFDKIYLYALYHQSYNIIIISALTYIYGKFKKNIKDLNLHNIVLSINVYFISKLIFNILYLFKPLRNFINEWINHAGIGLACTILIILIISKINYANKICTKK